MNAAAKERYGMPQEPEIDLEQRPDLQFFRPGLKPVPVEVKIADSWPIAVLLERLENQLVGQYLRDYQTRYGIYCLGHTGSKSHWIHPITNQKLTFPDVLGIIADRAKELLQ